MPPVICALLACLAACFRPTLSIQLEILAQRHRWRSIGGQIPKHASSRRIGCSEPGSPACGQGGKARSPSSSPAPLSRDSARVFGTIGDG